MNPTAKSVAPTDQRLALASKALKADNLQKHLLSVLPSQLKNIATVQRFTALTLSLVKTKDLEECSIENFKYALIRAATLGLEPDPVLGQLYFVPMKQGGGENVRPKVGIQIITGYRGLIELAYRSDRLEYINAVPVYPGDLFRYSEGTDPYIRHEPDISIDNSRQLPLAVYAISFLKGSPRPLFRVLPWWEIIQRRDSSPSYIKNKAKSPWTHHPIAMARKTAIRALAPFLPQSTELQRALAIEESEESDVIDAAFQVPLEDDDPPPQPALPLNAFSTEQVDRILFCLRKAHLAQNKAQLNDWLTSLPSLTHYKATVDFVVGYAEDLLVEAEQKQQQSSSDESEPDDNEQPSLPIGGRNGKK